MTYRKYLSTTKHGLDAPFAHPSSQGTQTQSTLCNALIKFGGVNVLARLSPTDLDDVARRGSVGVVPCNRVSGSMGSYSSPSPGHKGDLAGLDR